MGHVIVWAVSCGVGFVADFTTRRKSHCSTVDGGAEGNLDVACALGLCLCVCRAANVQPHNGEGWGSWSFVGISRPLCVPGPWDDRSRRGEKADRDSWCLLSLAGLRTHASSGLSHAGHQSVLSISFR